ncbi:MAG: S9 family peptidase [Candidatus Delongbacteria bacterium]|nr:S9 family peptidase [Candidatus Delongbacteria bacterium]
MEDFFKNPEKISVQISPNGEYLSWMEPWERRMNIHVKNMKTGEIKRLTAATERSIYWYIWASDDRLVYIMDKGGDENTRLYGVNLDGSNLIDFTPFEKVKCDIVDELEDDPKHIIFQMNKRNPEIFDIYRLDITTGEMTEIAENPGNITGWITDHDGKLRLATTTDGVNTGILYRETEEDKWKEIASYNFKESASPLFFTFDNKSVYVSSNMGRDKRAVLEYDLNTGKEGKLIFEHPEVDVYYLMRSRKRKVITGAYYVTDKRHFHFFDDFREKIQNFMDEKFPKYENSITSFDKQETKCVFYSGSDRTYGTYYYLDLINWEVTKLFDLAPWLIEDDMSEMKPIEYTSRDGLKINGYLTLPVGVEHKNLPVIINPHGGPWHRDQWGFNPEIQFLANRGYAILQMNFRGSTGYGREFLEIAYKQWGLTMQDDITDAVNWIIEEGIADPKKVAIYGGSYGGYATLMGIVKDPDLYAAAVDYVGVSNMFTFMETIPAYWEPMREMFYEMAGDPVKDKEQFEATSPALNADKIKTPLFVVQGANDPRVNINESDQMVEALKKRGVEVEYMVKDNEGHGFYNEENKFDFYRAMEKFLKKHIG